MAQLSVFILFFGLGVNCCGSLATWSFPTFVTGCAAGLKTPGGGGGGGGSPGNGGGGGGGGGALPPGSGGGGGGGGSGGGGGGFGASGTPAVELFEAVAGCGDDPFRVGDIALDNEASSSGLNADEEFAGLSIPGVLVPSVVEKDNWRGVRLRVRPSLGHDPSPWLWQEHWQRPPVSWMPLSSLFKLWW